MSATPSNRRLRVNSRTKPRSWVSVRSLVSAVALIAVRMVSNVQTAKPVAACSLEPRVFVAGLGRTRGVVGNGDDAVGHDARTERLVRFPEAPGRAPRCRHARARGAGLRRAD